MILIVVALLAMSLKGCHSTAPKQEPTAQDYEFDFHLEKDRIIIYPAVNGYDSLKFILDNGMFSTVFTPQGWEMMLRKGVSKPEFLHPLGSYFSYYLFPTEVKVGSYTYKKDTVQLGNQEWAEGFEIPDLKGFIGMDLFMDNIVQIDFEKQKVTLKQTLPDDIGSYEQYELLSFSKKDVPYYNKYRFIKLDGFYDLSGNAVTTNFLIDLGCVTNNLDYPFFTKINRDFSRNIDTNSLTYRLLFDYPIMDTYYIEAETDTTHIDNDRGGVIGIAFMKHHTVIFDYPNNRLYLKRKGQ